MNCFVDEFGLELRKNYPYIEKKFQCPYTSEVPRSEIGFMRIPSAGWFEIYKDKIEIYLKYLPVLIGMKIDSRYVEYGGGVHFPSDCSEERGLHASLIVGSGQDNNVEYWLIRNSLSSNWGENGHIRIDKRSDCFEPKEGYLLRAMFSPLRDENINYNYNGSIIEERRNIYVEMEKELLKRSEAAKNEERKFRR